LFGGFHNKSGKKQNSYIGLTRLEDLTTYSQTFQFSRPWSTMHCTCPVDGNNKGHRRQIIRHIGSHLKLTSLRSAWKQLMLENAFSF